MAAYLIADETVFDPGRFEEYKRRVVPSLDAHGARFLARGGELTVLESGRDWAPDRVVVIEFPDMNALRARYDSPDYAEVRELRFHSAHTTLVAVDGVAGSPAD